MDRLEQREAFQLYLSLPRPHPRCRRSVCVRYGWCTPPRLAENPFLFRCPFDGDERWEARREAVQTLIKHRMKEVEQRCRERGLPPPFARPPTLDHLDLSKPSGLMALWKHVNEPKSSIPDPGTPLSEESVRAAFRAMMRRKRRRR